MVNIEVQRIARKKGDQMMTMMIEITISIHQKKIAGHLTFSLIIFGYPFNFLSLWMSRFRSL